MSEQEKMNAVPAEGTITATEEKKSWFKRVAENPKVRKWAKRVATGAGLALTAVAGFVAGKAVSSGQIEPNCCMDCGVCDDKCDEAKDDNLLEDEA